MVPGENQGLRSNETGGALWSPWLCAMDTGVVVSHSHWPVLVPPAPALGAARNRCKLPAGKRHWQHRPGQVCTWTRGLGVDLDGIYKKDEGLGTVGLYSQLRDRGQKWWVIYKRARAQPSEELSPDG